MARLMNLDALVCSTVQPLYRHTLVLVVGGAVIMNCYHHAAGDGTSGQLPSLLVLLSVSDGV